MLRKQMTERNKLSVTTFYSQSLSAAGMRNFRRSRAALSDNYETENSSFSTLKLSASSISLRNNFRLSPEMEQQAPGI